MSTTTYNKSGGGVRTMAINALFVALTLVATMFINIRLPIMGNGGLIHLGNVPLFLAAIIYGKKTGAVAGAFGMGMFDVISGWTAWAPFTFIIVGAMGYTTGVISEQLEAKPVVGNAVAMFAALVIKIVGYYFAEVILYQNWIMPFGSIPGNITQVVVAAIIVLPIVDGLKKIAKTGGK